MRKIFIYILLILIVFASCKKHDSEVLSHSYVGKLTYEYSRNFPDFDCVVSMGLVVDKDGTVTFGDKSANSFEGEDIYYDASGPVLKMRVTGQINLNSATGQYAKINGKDCIQVWVNATTSGTKYIWNWDKNTETWVAPATDHEIAINYTDTYDKGNLPFSIEDACLSGSFVKDTIPDIHGSFIYGYGLNLIEQE
jgi:hypothetical protein